MFQKHTWVCSLCGQGLTRKSSANRHNNNLHSGHAGIVRPYEYIIGRINGNFRPPKDPLTYRHRKENGYQNLNGNNNNFTSKVIAESTQQPPKANIDTSFNVYTSFRPPIQSTPKTDDNNQSSSLDYSDKILEQRLKFEELSSLMNKYYQPENARAFLAMITFLLNQGNDNILDEKLRWLRQMDRLKFGSGRNIF
jgi:hypothetical protein